ncbi:hypothetical protein BDN72DRAFT_899354 [Pluteus cervinus]|uniref:Uncharacterized protein n=1 Tax=Pluteus cervinus TaxID=181527 RepID=A0ACD3AN83_9AGAR|nr:hypothetical protein BDN72DRAFT_899354 [Pluteus cervinus]
MAPDIIDLIPMQKFHESDWIGRGKTYPVEPPLFITEERAKLLELPSSFQQHLPSPQVSIAEFILWQMPKQPAILIPIAAKKWFSSDEPRTTPECLLLRNIPPSDMLKRLDAALSQAWFDGAKSITDPRYNSGRDRLPLWVLGFWKVVSQNIEVQKKWLLRIKWLKTEKEKRHYRASDQQQLFEMTYQQLSSLGWGESTTYLHGSVGTSVYMIYLSVDWLNDDHINVMMEFMARKLDPSGHILIAPLGVAQELLENGHRKVYERKKGAALLCRYEEEIKTKAYKKLFFPAYVGNHWIACCIDFEDETICYGDSYRDTCRVTDELMKHTRTWLSVRFSCDARVEGNTLPHGHQKDAFSCGIFTANTIAHNVFGELILTGVRAVQDRLLWFLKLTEKNGQMHSQSTAEASDDDVPLDDPYINTLLAVGDHNFPDLKAFVLSDPKGPSHTPQPEAYPAPSLVIEPPPTIPPQPTRRLGLLDLLNHVPPSDSPQIHSKSDVNEDLESPSDGPPIPAPDHNHPTCPMSSLTAVIANPVSNIARPQKTDLVPEFAGILGDLIDSEEEDGFDDVVMKEVAPTLKRTHVDVEEESDPKRRSSQPKAKRQRIENVQEKPDKVPKRRSETDTDPERYEEWQNRIRTDDKSAWFDPTHHRRVYHSKCGGSLLVKDFYDTTRWTAHLKGCDGTKNCRSVLSMPSWGSGPKPEATHTKQSGRKVKINLNSSDQSPDQAPPCPGLTKSDNVNIPKYLNRVSAKGGGGTDIHKLNQTGVQFALLSEEDKEKIRLQQKHSYRWRNSHPSDGQIGRIFSVKCSKVLKIKEFQNAVRRDVPIPENRIFTNKANRDPILGNIYASTLGLQDLMSEPAKDSVYVRYAKGALSGKYNDKVFGGLLQAMVPKHDKAERGKGMQNFPWNPFFKEFAHQLKITSNAAFRQFKQFLPAPTERMFRQHEARDPKFPLEIGDETFERAVSHLTSLGYSGPCSLGCDDTKLLSALRLYYDKKKKAHFIVGGVDGPVEVLDPDKLEAAIDELRSKRGTKIRVFTLSVGIPNVSPVIIAAFPIPNKIGADDLLPITEQVLKGLISQGIKVVSYACDGNDVERAIQRSLVTNAEKHLKYTISSPFPGGPDIDLQIPIISGQPVVPVQDSKHGLKTSRNNLFSGAHALVLGNHLATYSHIQRMARDPDSPIYLRDVEKLDRQDDNAAVRLFSAASLEFMCERPTEFTAEIPYIFIFGELIDAYQNRSITHLERIQMALRAYYFLHGWMAALDLTGHSKFWHTISHEARDIFKILIHGLLSLIFIYRDHLDELSPLFTWLHSSEICEHLFGEARQIVKDFTYLDFLYMIPKLSVKLRQHILREKVSDTRTTASGYTHTYCDLTGLNELNLATFPSDSEIEAVAQIAAEEADSLLVFLGLTPSQLRNISKIPKDIRPKPDERHEEQKDEVAAERLELALEENHPSDTQDLLNLIHTEDDRTLSRSGKQDDQIMNLTCATLSLMADDQLRLDSVICTEEDISELTLKDCSEVKAAANRFVMLQRDIPNEVSPSSWSDFDLTRLVELRQHHQTHHAAMSVRKHGRQLEEEEATPEEKLRRDLVTKFHELIRTSDANESKAGASRQERWQEGQAGGYAPSGNSGNAQVVAAQAAREVAQKRKKIFTEEKVPETDRIITGGVSMNRILTVGDFVFVYVAEKICLGLVLALYAKTAGKGVRHASTPSANNISAITYASVQVFEHGFGRSFKARTARTMLIGTNQFAHLPPFNMLTVLSTKPERISEQSVDVKEVDIELYRKLTSSTGLARFKEADRKFRARGPRKK